jgi:hypothetical protein
MKLPNSNRALISRDKLINYVLSETHTTGKFKAKFFRKLGFNETNFQIFENSLLKLAKAEEVKEETTSQFGKKYILEGEINSPLGKIVKVRTVWIIEKNQKEPRFITIYPV